MEAARQWARDAIPLTGIGSLTDPSGGLPNDFPEDFIAVKMCIWKELVYETFHPNASLGMNFCIQCITNIPGLFIFQFCSIVVSSQ